MTNKRDTTIFIGLLSIFWLLIAFLGYGYTHKPFLPEEFVGILLVSWRSLIAIIILSLAGGIGISIGFQEKNFSPLVNAMITSAFGLGIISISMLIIAATIGINFTLWIIIFIAIIIFRKNIFIWWKFFQALKNFWQEISKTGRIAVLLMTTILVCHYLEALAPPLHFDALTYHLAIPKAYIQTGHITYIQNNIFWGMPQLVEMLYTLAMYIGGTETAPILGWWIGLLALIGLVAFTKSVFEHEAAWVAAASVMAGSGLTTSISSGYVEWTSILYGLSVLICLSRWLDGEQKLMLSMTGIMSGMAIGVKYTNGIILITCMVVILFLQKSSSLKKRLTNIFWICGIATITMLPWLIKNLIATSNPFYPLFIPSGAMDTTLLELYQFKPTVQDWSRLILLPWQITIWGVGGSEGFSASIGPLLLGLASFTLIYWQKLIPSQKIVVKTSLCILLTGFLIWSVGSQFRGLLIQTRLYFIIFPAWALLAACGYIAISKINSHNIRFGKLAETFILLALLFNTFYTVKATSISNPLPIVLNLESRTSYLNRHLGGYENTMQMLKSLPGNPLVLMLWETRGFECLPQCDPDEIIGRWHDDWSKYGNSTSIIESWKKDGYTHVLINRTGADFVRKYDSNSPSAEYWQGLQATLNTLNPILGIAEGYELYKLP